MHSESAKDIQRTETFTGRDILYREGTVGLLDVQRAADALLRQGRKPSVAAIREQLGSGSPQHHHAVTCEVLGEARQPAR
jgi:hypothetical protein